MEISLKNIIKSMVALKTKWISIIIPMLVLGVLFFLITLNNVYMETYDVERFNLAKETIQAVDDRYNISSEINEEPINYINEIFDAINKSEQKVSSQEKVQHLQQILSPKIINSLDESVLTKEVQ